MAWKQPNGLVAFSIYVSRPRPDVLAAGTLSSYLLPDQKKSRRCISQDYQLKVLAVFQNQVTMLVEIVIPGCHWLDLRPAATWVRFFGILSGKKIGATERSVAPVFFPDPSNAQEVSGTDGV